MKSRLFKLDLKDLLKGLFVAVTTGVLTFVVQSLQTGVELGWKMVVINAVIAGCSYLIKNLFTNNQDEIFKADQ